MPDHLLISFGHGVVESRDSVRVICEIQQDDGPQSAVARWQPGPSWTLFPMVWVPTRIAATPTPQPCLYALGSQGRVGYGHGSYNEEQISLSGGPLRALRVVGGNLFAAGMGRQVYRRDGSGQWASLRPAEATEADDLDISGFTAFDGVDANDIWFCGYRGEIWRLQAQQRWQRFDSPTNLTLHAVRAVSPVLVFAAGKRGAVMRWDGANWRGLPAIEGVDDVWDLEWFADRLYAASTRQLLVLEGDTFAPVQVPGFDSFGHLHAADGVLWSFGTRQLGWTTDGKSWREESPLRR